MQENCYDYIVIGAGAAGLASAQYAARSGMKTLVLDLSLPGGQALNITRLENYPGIFPAITGQTLIHNMENQTLSFGAEIRQFSVLSIDKIGSTFFLETKESRFSSPAVLIATGAEHKILGIPGETKFSGKGVSYCATCDGPFFTGKRILVVGGGDSACSEAEYLADLTDSILIIHRRNRFRAQKTVSDRIFSNRNITVRFNTVIKEIRGGSKVESVLLVDTVSGSESVYPCDAVFVFVGMTPRTDLVSTLPTDESGYIKTDENMATCIPGLFCAGDVRSKPFRQLATAVSDGVIAAFSAERYVRAQRIASGSDKIIQDGIFGDSV